MSRATTGSRLEDGGATPGWEPLIVLNGPLIDELEFNHGAGVMRVGRRANTSIGRFHRMVCRNILGFMPGTTDMATYGHMFRAVVPENDQACADIGWEPLHVTRGIERAASAVTVMAAGAPRQIMNEWTTKPEEILETFAAEMRANLRHYSIHPGNYAIVVPKQLREHLQEAGWTKRKIAEFIHERARIHRREWAEVGKGAVVRDRGDSVYPAMESPDQLLVIAAGGPAGGFGAVLVAAFAGRFSVAVQDMSSRQLQVLTEGALDQSPVFSPNGRMILYASEIGGRGILAAVSSDGRVKQRFTESSGDIREPAWGPIVNK